MEVGQPARTPLDSGAAAAAAAAAAAPRATRGMPSSACSVVVEQAEQAAWSRQWKTWRVSAGWRSKRDLFLKVILNATRRTSWACRGAFTLYKHGCDCSAAT